MIRMYKYIFLLLIILSVSKSFSQEVSDPKAKAVLDRVKKQYNSYKTLEMDFTIETAPAEKKKTIESGHLHQSGKKYRLSVPQLISFSDGKSVWTYLKKNKEIQITDYKSKGGAGVMSPQELISIYENKDFIYAITGETSKGGISFYEIEFKPEARRSDISKIRLVINKKTAHISEAIAFYKDGSRYTIKPGKLITNQSIAASVFTYDAKEWPGIKVEDLRID